MPIKQNAKKALRQARKRAAENAIVRTSFRSAVKTARKAAEAGTEAKELLRLAQQKLDKAAKKGVIKKNTAARKLSRLMHYVATQAKKEVKK